MGKLTSKLMSIQFGDDNAVSISRNGGQIACSHELQAPRVIIGSISLTPGARLLASADFEAPRVWNAVWNDLADFQLLCDKLEYGKCYFDTKDGARICNERCQMSVIGIASDTFGFGVGHGANPTEVPIAVAGWVLAYVDKEYDCGTPLTNDANGNLTAISRNEKMEYPERIVAIYKRKEMQEEWGPDGQKISVNGRHWVKVK